MFAPTFKKNQMKSYFVFGVFVVMPTPVEKLQEKLQIGRAYAEARRDKMQGESFEGGTILQIAEDAAISTELFMTLWKEELAKNPNWKDREIVIVGFKQINKL